MVPNTVLLVRGAQGDCGDDRASVRIWVRPNVDSSSAKAVNGLLIELFELGMSIDGRTEGYWCHCVLTEGDAD